MAAITKPQEQQQQQQSLKLPKNIKDDERDVADLWTEALKAYRGIVGFDLTIRTPTANVQALVDLGTDEMKKFHKFRHDDKKVDTLRSLLSQNLGLIEQGAQQLISAATPAFPPAAAIATAVTWMLSACQQVSADYDVVEVFFNDMNSFLNRVIILEKRMPQHRAYRNCLMEVFTAFLKMCGFATEYTKLGRFKKWIMNLMKGEDGELGSARKDMDLKLDRLRDATHFAILGNTEELKKMDRELLENQQAHTQMLEAQTSMLHNLLDESQGMRSDIAKLLEAFEKKDSETKGQAKAQAMGQSKGASAHRIRSLLPDVEGEGAEYQILKETIVDGTCTWVFAQPAWQAWIESLDGEHGAPPRLLAITGEPGTGKSHIAATVYDQLHRKATEDAERHICAAHFYFREQHPGLSTLLNALITTANQIAEQSPILCEKIYSQLLRVDVLIDVTQQKSLLHNILEPCFEARAKHRLFLVLDGVDELSDPEKELLNEFWQHVVSANMRISLVVTSRPGGLGGLADPEKAAPLTINATKENQMSDLAALVRSRLGSLGALKRFGPYVKQKISEKIESTAPNLLYAQHMLRRFDAIGREGAVLRQLDQPMPPTLRSLYEVMLAECQRRTVASRQPVIATLLRWISFSFRPLVLDEAVSLLRYTSGDSMFDLDEIPELMTRFIRIGDPGKGSEVGETTEMEYLQTGGINEPVYNDGQLPLKFRQRSIRSFFRDAASESESDTTKSLLATPSEAHRLIFLTAANMARPAPEEAVDKLDSGLATYATLYLMDHWIGIDPEDHSVEERTEVMEVLASVMSNEYGYAKMAEVAKVDYKRDFNDDVLKRMGLWATEGTQMQLSSSAAEWWKRVAQKPATGLLELAKGHFQLVYQAPNAPSAAESYKLARAALVQSGYGNKLALQAAKNFPSTDGDGEAPDTDHVPDEAEGVLGLGGLFGDMELDAGAYRAIGSLLLLYDHHEEARSTYQRALECSPSPAETFKIFYLRAMSEWKLDLLQEASQSIADCLTGIDTDGVTELFKRWAYITKGRIEAKLGNSAIAAESYSKAKTYDSTTLIWGNILDEEIAIYKDADDYAGLLGVLKKWTPIERLTWLTWDYASPDKDRVRHINFQDAAARAGEQAYMVAVYEEVIAHLDNFDAAAPLRCDLADAYMLVCGDAEAAKRVLDEVLDSRSTGHVYKFTSEDPRSVLQRTISLQSRVLFELFAASRDPAVKSKLLDEVNGFMKRPLATSVSSSHATAMLHHDITVARMTLKVGPRLEFQKRMQKVFDACFEALEDNVGWNDGWSLMLLSQALAHLSRAVRSGEKLWHAGRVLLSAIFSRLDPDVSIVLHADNKDEDEDEDEDADPDNPFLDKDGEAPPEDEGDLTHIPGVCDGTICRPTTMYKWWGGRSGQLCLDCNDCLFCEQCYAVLLADKTGEQPFQSRRFCGRRHDHIKAPIEGWRGVKDGIINIEGSESMSISVNDFLTKVRDELIKGAWDQFWEG
ncbi:hypothetical protein B0T24DRAFT_200521 [Lasiosphaeria ovina]|uniref:NACHT domain-containing protein n=1 Tax=Lasiosphaeria ovina TaxID=92902 RepID=A0AAE0NFW7_9PEZI|nr:hypothetical protein B0T24DRAFT_200521 [Lasiosphaeria ovina]